MAVSFVFVFTFKIINKIARMFFFLIRNFDIYLGFICMKSPSSRLACVQVLAQHPAGLEFLELPKITNGVLRSFNRRFNLAVSNQRNACGIVTIVTCLLTSGHVKGYSCISIFAYTNYDPTRATC